MLVSTAQQNESAMCMHAQSLQLCPTLCNPMDVASQAPLSMGFSRQIYWTEFPWPPPGDLPDSGIKPVSAVSHALQADVLQLSHPWSTYTHTPPFWTHLFI